MLIQAHDLRKGHKLISRHIGLTPMLWRARQRSLRVNTIVVRTNNAPASIAHEGQLPTAQVWQAIQDSAYLPVESGGTDVEAARLTVEVECTVAIPYVCAIQPKQRICGESGYH